MTEGTRSVQSHQNAALMNERVAIATAVGAVVFVALAALAFWKGDIKSVLNGHGSRDNQLLCKIGVAVSATALVTLVATALLLQNASKEAKAGRERKARFDRQAELEADEQRRQAAAQSRRDAEVRALKAKEEQRRIKEHLKRELNESRNKYTSDVGTRIYDCFKAQPLFGQQYLIENMSADHVKMISSCGKEAMECVSQAIIATKSTTPMQFAKLWDGHGKDFAEWACRSSQTDTDLVNLFYKGLSFSSKRVARKAVSSRAARDMMFATSLAEGILKKEEKRTLFLDADLGVA